MFRLLDKLDFAFASLLQGRDIDSREPLPGFEMGRGVTGTEKVRIKSIADNSRVAVVHVMAQENAHLNSELEETDDTESSMDENDMIEDQSLEETDFAMSIARVYDKTIVELGGQLGENSNPLT